VIEGSAWFRFVVAALAVWRLAHLLAVEDGPWDLILRIRRKLETTVWGKMMDCFNCLSLWISIPFAFFVVSGAAERIVTWLALSGAACLADRLGKEPLVLENINRKDD